MSSTLCMLFLEWIKLLCYKNVYFTEINFGIKISLFNSSAPSANLPVKNYEEKWHVKLWEKKKDNIPPWRCDPYGLYDKVSARVMIWLPKQAFLQLPLYTFSYKPLIPSIKVISCKIIRLCSWNKDFVTFHTVTLSPLDSADFLGFGRLKKQKVYFFYRF